MNNHGKNEDLKDPYTFDSQDENDGENFQVFTLVNIVKLLALALTNLVLDLANLVTNLAKPSLD